MRKTRRLNLNKETVRSLSPRELARVHGGGDATVTCRIGCQDSQLCTTTASLLSWCWTCDCYKYR